MQKPWQLLPHDPAEVARVQRHFGCHPLIATILVHRGIQADTNGDRFWSPSLAHLQDPFLLADMEKAVVRIAKALEENETILIFGDYDVDGVTATTLLYDFLTAIGAQATYYIPHRITEGYGLQTDQIERLMRIKGLGLIITTDCGISSHGAVAAAAQKGIDVIVTDHHQAGESLPTALAVINPNRRDCPANLSHLAGVGVAFYLVIGLRAHLRKIGFWKDHPEPKLKQYCDLVALGTIADMVPLVAENRVLAKAGLALMQSDPRPGLAALIDVAQAHPVSEAEQVAFKLAPRINAAGRVAHAHLAVTLLCGQNRLKAHGMAARLDQLNKQRQEMEKDIVHQVEAHLTRHPEQCQHPALVLARPEWHLGVLGIVAARLVQRYQRPVILFALQNGMAKGSARSIPGVDLYRLLTRCSEDMIAYGGHAMAAGMSLDPDRLSAFQDHFNQAMVDMTPSGGPPPPPPLSVDARLTVEAMDDRLIEALEALGPYGVDHPEPLFVAENMTVQQIKTVGKHHRKMLLGQPPSKRTISAIQFNVPSDAPRPKKLPWIVFRLKWNHYGGRRTPQLIVEAL